MVCLAAGLGVLVARPIAIAIPALASAALRLLEGRARSLVSAGLPAALALALLPVALLLPAAFATLPARRPLARSDAFPLAWSCGGLLLLSVFPVKRHHYLIPLYPGAALLAVQAAWHSRREAGLTPIALAATLVQVRVIEPILDPGREKRAFLESVAARVPDGAIADYGGMHFAANWVLRRDVVPVLDDVTAAERFLAESAPRPAFLLVDRENLDRKGTPAGVQRLVEWPRALAPDLVLLGSNEECLAGPAC